MSRMSAAERRLQLVDAAIRVAAREGVAATTTRRIAAEAGVNLATVHYCFASKQDLLKEVLATIVTELQDAVQADLRPGLPVEVLLRDALRGLWTVVEKEPERQQLTYELTQYALRTDDLRELARWQYEVYYRGCTTHLTSVAEAAGVEWTQPMPVMARLLLLAIDGAVLGWLVDRDTERAEAALDAFATVLCGLSRPARP